MGRSYINVGALAALVASVAAFSACGETEGVGAPEHELSGVFGGGAGVPDPTLGGAAPTAGTASSAGSGSGGSDSLLDPCEDVPPGQLALLDDFDDGDSIAVFEQDREAYWFAIHDETPGSLLPDGEVVPELGGALDSPRAVRVAASGFSFWGAQLSANVSYLPESGIRCAFNASRFKGLRFWAKGSGAVHVQLSMPDTFSNEFGGTCDESRGDVCYDTHETLVVFQPEWTLHELPFTSFQQAGWGVPQLPLGPGRIRGLMLAFKPEDLPVDVKVDSFEWFEVATSQPGGEGGAGGGGAGVGEAGASAGGGAAGQGGTAGEP